MKKIMFALCSAMLASAASAAVYKVDEFHANARFAIDHFNTSTKPCRRYLWFDRQFRNLTVPNAKAPIDIVLPLSKLQTGSDRFTQHLKSADIFNADKYPEIRFVSTKFNFNGKKLLSVDGNLTMNGKTVPVKLKADKFNCYQSPMLKAEVCGGDFSTTIDRTKWGLDYLVSAGMSKKVNINIQIEAVKQ